MLIEHSVVRDTLTAKSYKVAQLTYLRIVLRFFFVNKILRHLLDPILYP